MSNRKEHDNYFLENENVVVYYNRIQKSQDEQNRTQTKEVMVDGPQLKVKVTEERDGRFSACTDLPGCASWGNTEEEAVANVKDAIALYIYSLIDDSRT